MGYSPWCRERVGQDFVTKQPKKKKKRGSGDKWDWNVKSEVGDGTGLRHDTAQWAQDGGGRVL